MTMWPAAVGMVFAWACSAQVVIPSTRYAVVAGYLDLSSDQLSRIVANAFRAEFDQPLFRIEQLNEEIAAETRQPQPDAASIGLRYEEIERVCREDASTRRGIVPEQMRILTEAQRAPPGDRERSPHDRADARGGVSLFGSEAEQPVVRVSSIGAGERSAR